MIPSPSQIHRTAAPRWTLHDFVRAFWGIAEPAAPFIDGWHIGALCEFLTAWRKREFANGVIGVSPGTGKSMLVDVLFPAWVWADEPKHKFLACAFDLELTTRDADRMVSVLESPLYQGITRTRLREDVRAKRNLMTTAGGYRFGTSPGGKGMGRHFNSVSINDPVKPQDVLDGKVLDVRAGLERAQRWIDGTLPTRRADPKTFGVMLTMQRLLEKDPAGIALARGWEHLCLPMRYVPKAQWIFGSWSAKLDPRTEPGELMHPARFPEPVVKEIETNLGEHASAQLQQNPIPRSGGLVEEQHLRFEWVEVPKRGQGAQYWIQVWDFAAVGTSSTHSAVSAQLWCAADVSIVNELVNTITDRDRGAEPVRLPREVQRSTHYLQIDDRWGIYSVPESEELFERTQADLTWQRAASIIIEAKAAGIGIIQRYQRKFPKVVAFHEINDDCAQLAKLDKLDRFRTNIGEFHACRVLLRPWHKTVKDPKDPSDGRGPDATRKEWVAFPRGARDDRVDGASMALARLVQGQQAHFERLRRLATMPDLDGVLGPVR